MKYKNILQNPASNGLRREKGSMKYSSVDELHCSTNSKIINLGARNKFISIRKDIGHINMKLFAESIAEPFVLIDNDGDGSPEDSRITINKTDFWPYSAIGQLKITYTNGMTNIGTGVLINYHHVLTAAHNLFRKDSRSWVKKVEFIPGMNYGQSDYDKCNAVDLMIPDQWYNDESPGHDIAVFSTDKDIGYDTGWLSILSYRSNTQLANMEVHITGYPYTKNPDGSCEKCGENLYSGNGKILGINDAGQLIHKIDTEQGQSGSPIRKIGDTEQIVGIHTFGSGIENKNRGVPIYFDLMSSIKSWVNNS